MAIQFFLKHEFVKQIIKEYQTDINPKRGEYKGLIFSVEFQQVEGSTEYVAIAKIEGANGKPSETGALPPIPKTLMTPCPHPPPCKSDGAGGFKFDTTNALLKRCY